MSSAASSTIAADRRAPFALAAIACLLLVPSVARAEGSAADALFREGRTLLDAKKYDEACPKLAESQRLEPGAGTLLALALCHEGQGKPATAAADLKKASELGRKNGRLDLANAADKRAAALASSVPHLVIHLPENEGESYGVRCDGEPIAKSDLGAPVAMDPGEHKIEVSAEGKKPRSYTVRISGPGTTEIVVDKLETARRAPPPKAEPHEEPAAATEYAPPARSEEKRGGAQRTVGLVIIGAGVVGLGAGAYFGGQALSQSGEASRACPTNGSCTDAGSEANERSKESFRAAVIGLGAGTVALTAGAIVYFLAPDGPAPRSDAARARAPEKRTAHVIPSVGPNGASLGVVGTF